MASVPTREETIGQQLCVLDQATPRLPQLVGGIAQHLGMKAPTRIIPTSVVARLPSSITGLGRESLGFLVEDEYDTSTAEAHASAVGLELPDIELTTQRWATYLVASRFGRIRDPEAGRFTTVEGSQTYVVGDPTRADTVFLHGLPWDGDSGRPLTDALRQTTARPDLPGMGRSSGSGVANEAWLASLLGERTEPVSILAHSLSTGIALRFAATFPERVRELVLISPFFIQQRAPWYLRFAPLTRRLLRVGGAAAMQRRLLGESADVDPAVESAYENLGRPGVSARIAGALSAASRTTEREALRSALDDCAVPVLIVHGERDPLVGPAPRDPVVTIDGAGHNPHLEQPSTLVAAVTAWRAARKPRRRGAG